MSERVFIIGAGKVGRGLSRAFRASGAAGPGLVEVLGLHGKRASDFATSHGDLPALLSDCNVVIIAVRDDQIEAALSELLTRAKSLRSGTAILHTSGIATPTGFEQFRQLGFDCGTFHPIVPFAYPEKAVEYLKNGWVGIDGDAGARAASRRLAAHVGSRTIDIPEGKKGAYHSAAVFAANFPMVLASISENILHSIGVPQRSAQQVAGSLMHAAVENLKEADPVNALTGPIVRGDIASVDTHLRSLNGDAATLYRDLSLAALHIAEQRGIEPAVIARLRGILTS